MVLGSQSHSHLPQAWSALPQPSPALHTWALEFSYIRTLVPPCHCREICFPVT